MNAERTIARPADEVFAFIADASNNPRWQRGMVACEWMTPAPTEVGSRYRQRARFLGRSIESVFEVTALDPGRSITIETIESTFPIKVTRSVEPADDSRCVVRAQISGGPKVPAVLSGLMRRIAQRSVDSDYDRLVKLLEERTG
ncbi:MAG: SRPBCC family protein [Acidimicrobiia bacterium]|nr:SRPBCC family protein [Acidimicrobiia bacterium]